MLHAIVRIQIPFHRMKRFRAGTSSRKSRHPVGTSIGHRIRLPFPSRQTPSLSAHRRNSTGLWPRNLRVDSSIRAVHFRELAAAEGLFSPIHAGKSLQHQSPQDSLAEIAGDVKTRIRIFRGAGIVRRGYETWAVPDYNLDLNPVRKSLRRVVAAGAAVHE